MLAALLLPPWLFFHLQEWSCVSFENFAVHQERFFICCRTHDTTVVVATSARRKNENHPQCQNGPNPCTHVPQHGQASACLAIRTRRGNISNIRFSHSAHHIFSDSAHGAPHLPSAEKKKFEVQGRRAHVGDAAVVIVLMLQHERPEGLVQAACGSRKLCEL